MIESEIKNLINLKTEGAYWDFKEKWHDDNCELLQDIICMANNLEDKDAYIIIGVSDDGKVCGVPEDGRKNQQNLIDFLKDKKFAGGIRPTVYVQSLLIMGNTVDVIIIKNTSNTPYFLTERFRSLCEYNIYTRIVDVNTAKNGSADINHVEWLWKKRFGLIGSLDVKLKCILQVDGWKRDEKWYNDLEDWNDCFFNEFYPEIKIEINEIETKREKKICTTHDKYFYLYANHMFWDWHHEEMLERKCYDIQWHGNGIKKIFTIRAPKMDFEFVEPQIAFASKIGITYEKRGVTGVQYAYFLEDSLEYMLFRKILPLQASDDVLYKYNIELEISDLGMGVIPIFANNQEYAAFMNYVYNQREQFKLEYEAINVDDDMFSGGKANEDPRIKQSYRIGKLLVYWLMTWRTTVIMNI